MVTPGKKRKTRLRDLSSGKKYKIPHFSRKEFETTTVWFPGTLNQMVRGFKKPRLTGEVRPKWSVH